MGLQIVTQHWSNKETPKVVLPGDESWPRLRACGRHLLIHEAPEYIAYELIRVDQISYFGGLLSRQFSYLKPETYGFSSENTEGSVGGPS